MKHTAVEWLYNKMLYIDNEYDMKLITKSEYQFKRRDIIEQAKEMEKQQLKAEQIAKEYFRKQRDECLLEQLKMYSEEEALDLLYKFGSEIEGTEDIRPYARYEELFKQFKKK